MIRRILLILFTAFLFSCGKGNDKQEEYVDDKPGVQTETKKDSLPDVKKEEPVNTESKENTEYKRTETPVAVISPLDATEYMGKYVTVKGFVADVYKSERVAYLNFVKKFPDNPFSGVIFAREFELFGDLNIYANKNVEVTGRVSTYRGKPQMILDKPSQLKIVN